MALQLQLFTPKNTTVGRLAVTAQKVCSDHRGSVQLHQLAQNGSYVQPYRQAIIISEVKSVTSVCVRHVNSQSWRTFLSSLCEIRRLSCHGGCRLYTDKESSVRIRYLEITDQGVW